MKERGKGRKGKGKSTKGHTGNVSGGKRKTWADERELQGGKRQEKRVEKVKFEKGKIKGCVNNYREKRGN